MKRYLLILSSVLLLSGCADGVQIKSLSNFKFTDEATAQEIPKAPRLTPEAREEKQRLQFCEYARKIFHLPVLYNAERRKEAYEVLGRERANQLFWPSARTNNAFRCLCGTPEERLKARCKV